MHLLLYEGKMNLCVFSLCVIWDPSAIFLKQWDDSFLALNIAFVAPNGSREKMTIESSVQRINCLWTVRFCEILHKCKCWAKLVNPSHCKESCREDEDLHIVLKLTNLPWEQIPSSRAILSPTRGRREGVTGKYQVPHFSSIAGSQEHAFPSRWPCWAFRERLPNAPHQMALKNTLLMEMSHPGGKCWQIWQDRVSSFVFLVLHKKSGSPIRG